MSNYDRHGERVKAIHFDTSNSVIDDNETVPPGTLGMIIEVDDFDTIHVAWDNGSTLGVLPADQYETVDEAPIKFVSYKYRTNMGTYESAMPGQCGKDTATRWTVHLNLDGQPSPQESLATVLDRLSQLAGVGLTGEYSSGDSWAAWGETPDGSDDHALHIYFRADNPTEAWRCGSHIADHAFFSHAASIDFAISTAGDWAEQLDVSVSA